jgi:hypothetical protein|tara:strand:+ start:1099 stop:1374 length:276 start_codon:yes stop_codon:yes gene_type:complete
MATFNSVANVSARNEKKKKLNLGDTAYVYMSGGVHSPDARPKKKYKRGGAGLYANIHAKRQRIASGSGETMRKPGEDGAPAKGIFKKIAEG